MPATITGTLQSILGGHPEEGTVEVALCGYGSQVPRMNNATMGARLTDATVTVDDQGKFTMGLTGNELIAPQGTYYTITIRDSNGDVAQINAYRFADGQSYDLNTAHPIDPDFPPAPLPPSNQLVEVAPGNPIFDGSRYTAWEITLDEDVTAPVFEPVVDGNLYTLIVIQTAGFSFVYPDNVLNAQPVSLQPNIASVQTFVADTGTLISIGPGTYNDLTEMP